MPGESAINLLPEILTFGGRMGINAATYVRRYYRRDREVRREKKRQLYPVRARFIVNLCNLSGLGGEKKDSIVVN